MKTSPALITKRLVPELAFVLPIALLVTYLPDADSVDQGFFGFYLAVAISVRLWHRKLLDEWGWLVFHISVVLVLLSELNKLDGYPSGHDATVLLYLAKMLFLLGAIACILCGIRWSALSIFIALFIVTPCVYLAANALGLPTEVVLAALLLIVTGIGWTKASRAYVLSGLLAAVVLYIPVLEGAMHASRQAWFQTLPSYRPCVYATKISDSTVYGVDLRDRLNIVWFNRTSAPTSSTTRYINVTGLGAGTMEAQSPNLSQQIWTWTKSRSCPK